jgi:hypothetical protein
MSFNAFTCILVYYLHFCADARLFLWLHGYSSIHWLPPPPQGCLGKGGGIVNSVCKKRTKFAYRNHWSRSVLWRMHISHCVQFT